MNKPAWKQTTIGWLGEYRGLMCGEAVGDRGGYDGGFSIASRSAARTPTLGSTTNLQHFPPSTFFHS